MIEFLEAYLLLNIARLRLLCAKFENKLLKRELARLQAKIAKIKSA